MFQTFKNAWKIDDLRRKIIFTLIIIVIFRIGCAIPVPFLDAAALQAMTTSTQGNFLGYLNVLSGGAFSNATVFAMSISPYITSSIVVQLLTVAIPALERMAKEGEEGQKKINKITRYVTVALGLVQGTAYYLMLRNQYHAVSYTEGFEGILTMITIILTFTAGAAVIVWLGEQVNEKGIGNGISIILFAGIVSRGSSVISLFSQMISAVNEGDTIYLFYMPLIIVIFLAIIVFIVIMTNAERRIPVQYAKKVVGRKMYGGQSTHIPIKVNMAGVLPIIFASSFLAIPGTIAGFMTPSDSWVYKLLSAFNYRSGLYAVLYLILIIAFSYFYISIQYNPVEMANNLRKNNGTIPGIRPGRPTAQFISRVLSKITFIGALFLAIIAILPIAFGAFTGLNIALGGTSVLIIVGVALETTQQLESQIMMRHYKGFLE